MSADIWAYSHLIKTTKEEYKEKYQKTADFRHNYFDVLLVEKNYAAVEKKIPGIMNPFKVDEIYAVSEGTTIYQGNIGDSSLIKDFLEALDEFATESVEEENAFSELQYIIDYDMLVGTLMCDKLYNLFEDNQSEFVSWCKQNELTKQFIDIYKIITHAMSIGKCGGCALIE